MLSLIWKDVVAAGALLRAVLLLGVLQLAVSASVGPVFLPAALLLGAVLAFGSLPIEEVQRTESLWNSLPVSRATVVGARYLSTLIGMLAGFAVSWAVGQVITRLMGEGGAGYASVFALALPFAFLVLAAALFLPFYFHAGLGRGLIRCAAVSVVLLLGVGIVAQVLLSVAGYTGPMFDPATWEEPGPEMVAWLEPRLPFFLGGIVAFSLVAMVVSWGVSQGLYEVRDL